MENTTKAGIGAIVGGVTALVAFVVKWITTKTLPSPEEFTILGGAVTAAISAGVGLIKAEDAK